MTERPYLIAVGQLPPPVNGFSYITSRMVATLALNSDVDVVNVSPGSERYGLKKHAHRARQTLRACARIISNTHSPRLLYVGCEGDWGLVYTAGILACAALRKHTIYLHHHSFSYIDQSYFLMRLILSLAGSRIEHVFLCETMELRFRSQYGSIPKTHIISNAAFVDPISACETRDEHGPIRIGLLSNLTREKGLHTFLDLVRQARDSSLDVIGVLAGPVSLPEDEAYLRNAMKQLGNALEYLGPLYGESKDHFYESIDVFVFPTEYANEAQPTVLFEAQAAGNRIISFKRGCIAEQVGKHGTVVDPSEDFLAHALRELRELIEYRKIHPVARFEVRQDYLHRHRTSIASAVGLVRSPRTS